MSDLPDTRKMKETGCYVAEAVLDLGGADAMLEVALLITQGVVDGTLGDSDRAIRLRSFAEGALLAGGIDVRAIERPAPPAEGCESRRAAV